MEFNVLPRAKILSPHSANKTNQTTNQTVNVILPNPKISGKHDNDDPNIKEFRLSSENEQERRSVPASQEQPPNPYQELEPGEVRYETREVKLDEPGVSLSGREAEQISTADSIATINFLKLVLESYISNPIKYNGYVICSVPVLENLIETLTSCDDCDVEIADFETGCCGTSTAHILPITKIWVKNNGSSEIFKYKYSQFLQVFEQYHISLKFVYVQ